MTPRVVLALLAIAAWLAASGCARSPDGGGTPDGDDADAAADAAPTLPSPPLDALEPAVRHQLEQARAQAEAALAGAPDAAARGAALGELGRHYHAYRLTVAAEDCYRQAAALDPGTPRWAYYLGQLRLARGAAGNAVAPLERAAAEADDGATWTALGRALHQSGQPAAARRALATALERAPSAMAHFTLGQLAAESDDWRAAVDHYRAALALQPEASTVQLPLAMAYRALGDSAAADAALARRGERAIAFDDPWLAEVEALAGGAHTPAVRGAAAFERGELEAAETAFRAALAAEDSARNHRNLGAVLMRQERRDEAAAAFAAALERDPENAEAHFDLGLLEAARGSDAIAVDHYRRALAIDPGHRDARFNLANAQLRLGRFAACADAYQAVVEAEPARVEAWLGAVVCSSQAGEHQAALTRARAGRSAVPAAAALIDAEARLLAAAPDPAVRDGARALSMVEALIAHTTALEHVITLAMAHAERGDFAAAVAWQVRALDAVRQSGRADLVPALAANLARYRAGEPCRQPWDGAAFGGRW